MAFIGKIKGLFGELLLYRSYCNIRISLSPLYLLLLSVAYSKTHNCTEFQLACTVS